MLYRVTAMLPAEDRRKDKAGDEGAGGGRKRRKAAVYDAEGNEVLISMVCLKCRQMRPLAMFGLRKMADGAIRNQPWCKVCRGAKKPKGEAPAVQVEAPGAAE